MNLITFSLIFYRSIFFNVYLQRKLGWNWNLQEKSNWESGHCPESPLTIFKSFHGGIDRSLSNRWKQSFVFFFFGISFLNSFTPLKFTVGFFSCLSWGMILSEVLPNFYLTDLFLVMHPLLNYFGKKQYQFTVCLWWPFQMPACFLIDNALNTLFNTLLYSWG